MKICVGITLCLFLCLQAVKGQQPTILYTPTISERLQIGSKGAGVKRWQQFLIQQKLMVSPADGIYGHNTAKATEAFQLKYNLNPDGIVGPNTSVKAEQLGYKPSNGNFSKVINEATSSSPHKDGKRQTRISMSDRAIQNNLIGSWELRRSFPGGFQIAVETFNSNGTLQLRKESDGVGLQHIRHTSNGKYYVTQGNLVETALYDIYSDGTPATNPDPKPWVFHIKIIANKLMLVPISVPSAYRQDVPTRVLTRM